MDKRELARKRVADFRIRSLYLNRRAVLVSLLASDLLSVSAARHRYSEPRLTVLVKHVPRKLACPVNLVCVKVIDPART